MHFKRFNLILKKKITSFNQIITVDSDKSMSIRALLIGAISENISSVTNILESEDVKSTVKCLKNLGIKLIRKKPGKYLIFGKGLGCLAAKKNLKLNFGNSGTLARLLIGILSTTKGIEIKLTGDHSLNKRSMKKLIILLSEFGASFFPKKKYKFPLKMISTDYPIGINYRAGVSAQLKSAAILAGLNAFGKTEILEKEKSRDHTENMLLSSDVIKIKRKKIKIISVFGKKPLNRFDINIPGDPSSAAFFTALALLNKRSKLIIKNVGLNNTRTGFYQILKNCGANISFKNQKKSNNELRGDIIVKNSKIKPIKAPKKYYVNSTDEYPILFVIAALTNGVSVFEGISDLANKESDRIKEMQKVLNQIGIKTKSSKNNFKIFGKGTFNASKKNIKVSNLGDHRICMSTFVLASLTGARAKINNFETVFTSSPSFLKIMKTLGAKFEIQK